MADVSKIKVPGDNTIYNLKDAVAVRTEEFEQDVNNKGVFDHILKDANGSDSCVRGITGEIDSGDLIFREHYPDSVEICRIPIPTQIKFEPNIVTPTECWVVLTNQNDVEFDRHWLLWTRDGNDIVLKDLDHDVDVFRIPVSMFQP